MNYRQILGFAYLNARGDKFPNFYRNFKKSTRLRQLGDIERKCLSEILRHSISNVPYYRDILESVDGIGRIEDEPVAVLKTFPSLTKDIIRKNYKALQANDIDGRRWFHNTSGGSTGEPIKLIQDREYQDRALAVTHLYYWLIGHEIGQKMIKLWGSERDILAGREGIKAVIKSHIWNIDLLNAFRMTPEKMKQYLSLIESKRPNLILAYAQSIYELAQFAERSGIRVAPQRAIMTSAGTLFPFMREKIEEVFRCKVFNRYGSREVGDIACEHPESGGLWVAPWGCYIEVVDEFDNSLPPETEGDILVTSLTNFAMPLIRYRIGDRGVLSSNPVSSSGLRGQVLLRVSGRNVDMFKRRDGTLIDGEYFTHLLYFRDWVRQFQFIQQDFNRIGVNVVKTEKAVPEGELVEITRNIQVVMGEDCEVEYHFPETIIPTPSGKYRYTISEVTTKEHP